MKLENITLGSKRICILLLGITCNLAIADESEDRISVYKSNNLLPMEVELQSLETAGTTLKFTKSSLTWVKFPIATGNFSEDAISARRDKWSGILRYWSGAIKAIDSETGEELWDVDGDDIYLYLYDIANRNSPEANGITKEIAEYYLSVALDPSGNTYNGDIGTPRFEGINVPDAIDVAGMDLRDKNLSGDFSRLENLTPEQLSTANWGTSSSIGYKFPNGFDVGSLDFTGKYIYDCGLESCKGLTAEQLNSVASDHYQYWSEGIKLPSGMDLTGLNKLFPKTDYTNTVGLTVDMLNNNTGSLYGAILPAMDISGFTGGRGEWSYADFSNTTGLKASVIAAQYGNNLMGPVTISQATWDSYTTEEQEQIKNYVTVKPNRNHTGG